MANEEDLKMKQRLLMVFALVAIGGVSLAKADTLFMSVPGTSDAYTQAGNDGFTFTPTENIIVTALDYYVSPIASNTLVYPHGVAIYSATTQALLLETTVGPCTPAAACNLVGGGVGYSSFASAPITPTELYAGVQYMLAGYSQPLENENGGTPSGVGLPLGTIITPSGITLNGYYYDYNGSVDYPTIPYSTAYVGPDFQFSAVPDGGTTLALLGLAVAGLVGLRRKLSV
jgi:hypothetical protein